MLVNLVKPVRMKKIIIKFQKVIVTMKSTIKKKTKKKTKQMLAKKVFTPGAQTFDHSGDSSLSD